MNESEGGRLEFPTELISEAQQLAERTLERFAHTPGFYRNTSNSHLVGKLGELLVETVLMSEGLAVDSAFRDESREKECDLLVGDVRLEVKTWNVDYWSPWGRCIAVTQLPTIRRKADVLVWGTVSSPQTRPLNGTLCGWNYVDDFDGRSSIETGPVGRKVLNYQMPINEVRPLAALIELLRTR